MYVTKVARHFPAGELRIFSSSERSACQQHFLDVCELLGQPKPAEADRDGSWYTFEKAVETSEDKKGWADVWMRAPRPHNTYRQGDAAVV